MASGRSPTTRCILKGEFDFSFWTLAYVVHSRLTIVASLKQIRGNVGATARSARSRHQGTVQALAKRRGLVWFTSQRSARWTSSYARHSGTAGSATSLGRQLASLRRLRGGLRTHATEAVGKRRGIYATTRLCELRFRTRPYFFDVFVWNSSDKAAAVQGAFPAQCRAANTTNAQPFPKANAATYGYKAKSCRSRIAALHSHQFRIRSCEHPAL